MSTAPTDTAILTEIRPGRMYSSSVLRAARHFWSVPADATATVLADELQRRPQIQVVAVLAEDGRALGLIRRDRLFALVSKPFGREILGRTPASELAEESPVYDAHAGIFAVAQDVLGAGAEEISPYQLLIDEGGSFQATLSAQDLANYMSRITQDDIELAGKLQERLQESNEAIGGEGWSFEAWSRPAKGVGGDFYFTRRMDDGRVFLALCDVSGKGVAASLVVSMTWGMLRVFDLRRGLGELIRTLNEAIVTTFHLEKYLTGFFAVYDPATRNLSLADMGHSHVFLFRGRKAISPHMRRGNLPIGIERDIDPAIGRWRLEAGDRLFIYSDGLTEQENAAGEEYGERRLIRATSEAQPGAEGLHATVSEAIDAFRGRTPQQDDMSFMLLSLDLGGTP